jgi:hypothetical protein
MWRFFNIQPPSRQAEPFKCLLAGRETGQFRQPFAGDIMANPAILPQTESTRPVH